MVMDVDAYDAMPYRIADRYLIECAVTGYYYKVNSLSVCAVPEDPGLVALDINYTSSPYLYPAVTVHTTYDAYHHATTGNWVPVLETSYTGIADIPLHSPIKYVQERLVYDFSDAIPQYTEAAEIHFGLVFTLSGSPEALTATGTYELQYEWNKGVYFQPLSIQRLTNGYYKVMYEAHGNEECPCGITCSIPTGWQGALEGGPLCLEKPMTAYFAPTGQEGEPPTMGLSFYVASGNFVGVTIQPMVGVTPLIPVVSTWEDGVKIGIPYKTFRNLDIVTASFRVEKFVNSVNNISILTDWSREVTEVFDQSLAPNNLYGYRLIYKSPFGDISEPSEWATIWIS